MDSKKMGSHHAKTQHLVEHLQNKTSRLLGRLHFPGFFLGVHNGKEPEITVSIFSSPVYVSKYPLIAGGDIYYKYYTKFKLTAPG